MISKGTLKVRVRENSASVSINHVDDSTKYITGSELSFGAQSG